MLVLDSVDANELLSVTQGPLHAVMTLQAVALGIVAINQLVIPIVEPDGRHLVLRVDCELDLADWPFRVKVHTVLLHWLAVMALNVW